MFLSTFGRRRWSSCSTKTTKTTAFMMVLLFLWTIIDDEVSALTTTTTTTTTTRKTVTIRHNIFQAGRQFPQVERNDVLRPYSSTALFAAGS
jgi:ABC-type siderophore export system fused ATPase/permease subunit